MTTSFSCRSFPTSAAAATTSSWRIDIGRNGWGGENSSFPYEEIVVHADGRIVADGVERQVDAAGLARILDAAAAAGLAGGGRDYGEPAITDQGSVVVEVATDDRSVHRVAVYALGMEDVDDGHLGLTRGQFRARRQLTRFIDLVAGAGASCVRSGPRCRERARRRRGSRHRRPRGPAPRRDPAAPGPTPPRSPRATVR